MRCEYEFCIYNKNNKCLLENINIDSLGLCADCILPDIDPSILQQAKNKVLERFQKAHLD